MTRPDTRVPLALLVAVLLAAPVPAQEDAKEVRRLEACAEVLTAVLGMPEAIPRDLLDKAECVIVVPSAKKAALGLGARWGKGAASCRRQGETGAWSAPLMMTVGGGSVGFQIGGQAADYVLLVMKARGMESLLKNKFTLGADASVAAGPKGRTGTAATDAYMEAEILTYSRTRGIFAGVSIEGMVVHRDDDGNERLYGEPVSAQKLLFEGRYATPPEARPFLDALETHSPIKNPEK